MEKKLPKFLKKRLVKNIHVKTFDLDTATILLCKLHFLTFFEHSVRCYRSLSPSPPFTGTMESWGAAPFLVQDMKHILHTFFFYKWSMPPKLSFHNKLTLVDHVWFTIFFSTSWIKFGVKN